jgi:hypothetical protein
MKVYDIIFLNHYNYYGRTIASKPDVAQSIIFISTIELFHIYILSTPFNYFGQFGKGYNHSKVIITIIVMAIFLFNLFYYNGNKIDKLINEYNCLSDDQKQKNRIFSLGISIFSWLGFFGATYYGLTHMH